ncbi:MAG TPA: hypothetical protein VGM83_16230 [Devosiaceae bacterium]|jgi:hypothetical protein
MKAVGHFTVQPFAENGRRDNATCIHVEAMGPIQAAELALGETLAVHGTPDCARAMVWKLNDDYSPVSVTLYRSAMTPDEPMAISPSRREAGQTSNRPA